MALGDDLQDAPDTRPAYAQNLDFSKDDLSGPVAFFRGVGNGLSAGLTNYPAAAVDMAVNGNPKLSWAQQFQNSLANVRQQNTQEMQQHPAASLTGNVVGSVIGANKLAGVMKSVGAGGTAANIGANAAQGTVSHLANTGDENGAVFAGALQGAVAGVAGLAGKAIGAGANYARNLGRSVGIQQQTTKVAALVSDAQNPNSPTAQQSADALKAIFPGKNPSPTAQNFEAFSENPGDPMSPTRVYPGGPGTVAAGFQNSVAAPKAWAHIVPQPNGSLVVDAIDRTGLPSGQGADLLAAGLDKAGLDAGGKFSFQNIMQPGTLAAFNAGKSPVGTTLANTAQNAMKKLGLTIDDIQWDPSAGRTPANMTITTKPAGVEAAPDWLDSANRALATPSKTFSANPTLTNFAKAQETSGLASSVSAAPTPATGMPKLNPNTMAGIVSGAVPWASTGAVLGGYEGWRENGLIGAAEGAGIGALVGSGTKMLGASSPAIIRTLSPAAYGVQQAVSKVPGPAFGTGYDAYRQQQAMTLGDDLPDAP